MSPSAEPKKHLYEILKEFDAAMLVTRSHAGQMHARPMAVVELEPDAEAYFVTAIDSAKTAEIEENPTVTLTFQGSNRFATVSGEISVVRDRAEIEKRWKEAWRVWFPKGKTDPAICLLRFDAEHGELWDNTGMQGVKYAFEAAKAYATGTQPETDRTQHSDMNL